MNKKYFFVLLLICPLMVFGQMKTIPQKIYDLNKEEVIFHDYDLLQNKEDDSQKAKYIKAATEVTLLEVNSELLVELADCGPKLVRLNVPFKDRMITVELYREKIMTPGFHAEDEKNNTIHYNPGKYYRGIVQGDYNSLVSFSFFKNNIIGLISTREDGNIIIGKSVDGRDFVSYADRDLLGRYDFVCEVDDMEYNQQKLDNTPFFDPQALADENPDRCVKIYYELAHQVYVTNNSDLGDTLDWLTGIHNEISVLYDNDDISISLNAVMIWTEEDPYDVNTSQMISTFKSNRPEFDGDIAKLIRTPATSGRAYVATLCTPGFEYAYSGVDMDYESLPVYSWTVNSIAHELGHVMASQHTHACVWNGNWTAIDKCGPEAGFNEGCVSAPLPTNGGTIMSYCHLLEDIGINFVNGFGPQPAAYIRTIKNGRTCLDTNCIDAEDLGFYKALTEVNPPNAGEIEGEGTYVSNDMVTMSATALTGYTFVNWEENGVEITTDSVYEFEITEDRNLTANFLINSYTLTTQTNDTEGGTTEGDGQFDYGTNVSVTAIAFSGYNFAGWYEEEVLVSENEVYEFEITGDRILTAHFIDEMSVSDFDKNDIRIYPNPFGDMLNIKSEADIINSAILYDFRGRLLLQQEEINQAEFQIDTRSLPTGNYFLKIQTGKGSKAIQVIKKG